MSLVRRLTATLRAQIDAAVTRIEDHDAVIAAAIGEARHALAEGRVRLARVQRDEHTLAQRVAALGEEIASWEQRARRCADEDAERALACVARRNDCRRRLEHTTGLLERHRILQTRLEQELQQAGQRLDEQMQQRQLMRTRSATTEALRTMNALDTAPHLDMQAAFERWEVRLTESELATGTSDAHAPAETFEQEFRQAEDCERLRAELDELLRREQS